MSYSRQADDYRRHILSPEGFTEFNDITINDNGQVAGCGDDAGQMRGFIAIPTQNITEADNGKTITLLTGAQLKVELGGSGVTGYNWDVETYDKGVLELVSHDTYPVSEQIGAPSIDLYTFRALAGAMTLTFGFHHPWEGMEQSVKHFSVLVEVK
jgi:predicted secreted protein